MISERQDDVGGTGGGPPQSQGPELGGEMRLAAAQVKREAKMLRRKAKRSLWLELIQRSQV
jgi:hypothetical protein